MGKFQDIYEGAAQAGSFIQNLTGAKTQFRNQRNLMDIQFKKQQQLNEQAFQYGKQMFDYTSYPHQVELMKEAGLNVGLMYDKGGHSGTTSVPSGGGASGGNAGMPHYMGIEAITQMKLANSQVKLNEAQANKLNVDAAKTGGADTEKTYTEIASLKQGIENQEAVKKLTAIETEIAQLQRDIQDQTKEFNVRILAAQSQKIASEAWSAIIQAGVDDATENEKINIVKQTLAGMLIENELKTAQIGKTQEETKKIATDIVQKWKELEIKQWEAEVKAMYPSIFNVGGNFFERMNSTIEKMLGEKARAETRKME